MRVLKFSSYLFCLCHFGLCAQDTLLPGIKYKTLDLQVEFMEDNKVPLNLPNLNNLPFEKVVIYEDRYWLRALSPDNRFLDLTGEVNPHGTNSPGTSIVLGGLNAILQKIQE